MGFVYCSQNHLAEHIVERTDMPERFVKEVHGELVYEQTQPRVSDSDRASLSKRRETSDIKHQQQ